MTPHSQIAPYTFFTLEGWRINRKLHELGMTLLPEQMIHDVKKDAVTVSSVYAVNQTFEHETDAVVLVTQRNSNDHLYRELRSNRELLEGQGIRGLYRIGDCVVPRLIADAVFDGHRLAREIDTDDPATPLPFIREYRVLGAEDADYDSVVSARHRNPEWASIQPTPVEPA
jgi:dimethylamine/trimethylamine dehydrogenase